MSARPAIVGAFILGAVGLGVAAILFFGGMRMFTKTSRAVVFFSESLAGLDVGAPVTFHGVRVGVVKNITVQFSASSMSARTPVFLEFQPAQVTLDGGKTLADESEEMGRLIKAGLRAQLELQSIVTGQLRVDLDFRPDTPVKLVGEPLGVPEIPALPSELGQLWAQLTQLRLQEFVDTGQRALASFERLSNRIDAVLDPLVGNANEGLVAARQTFRTADDAIRQLQREILTALRDLDALAVDARHQLGARGTELSRALASADRTARQAETLLQSLNGLAHPRSQLRGDLEAAIRDLAAASSSLRDFAATIERNPNALLMGRDRQ